jgi:hypothetical protein
MSLTSFINFIIFLFFLRLLYMSMYISKIILGLSLQSWRHNFSFFVKVWPSRLKFHKIYDNVKINQLILFNGVGVAFWYFSITPPNNSRVVVKNLRIIACRSGLCLTIQYVILKIGKPHHQVLSQF